MLKKWLVTALVILAGVVSVDLGRKYFPGAPVPVVDEKYRARALGDPKAPLWIVEYLDFQCETCRDSMRYMEEFMKKNPKKAYLQVRYYPLILNHIYALKSAIYSECASRQGKFHEFTHELFDRQEEWAHALEADDIFNEIARKQGLDAAKLGGCIEDPAVKELVLEEKKEGKELGVRLTPTFFMDGERIEGFPAMKIEMEKRFGGEEEKK